MTQTVSGFTVPAGSDPVSSIDDTLATFAGEVRSAINAATELPSQTGNAGKYLKTDGSVASWATVAAGGGKVLQVVQGTTTTATTIATSTLTDTTITASITPSATTSKILVLVDAQAYLVRASNTAFTGWALLRGASNIFDRSNEGFMCITANGSSAVELVANSQMTYLDSPASTSSLTYKVQAKAVTGSLTFQRNSVPSSITLIEIGA